MGEKGAELTNVATKAAEALQASLFPLGDIHIKKMFGGYGVFESGTMFALVNSAGGIFFKVDDSNRQQYEKAGSQKHGRMPYYQLPDLVWQDEEKLRAWAKVSIAVSVKGK